MKVNREIGQMAIDFMTGFRDAIPALDEDGITDGLITMQALGLIFARKDLAVDQQSDMSTLALQVSEALDKKYPGNGFMDAYANSGLSKYIQNESVN